MQEAANKKRSNKGCAIIFFGLLAIGLIKGLIDEGSDFLKVDTVKASSWDGSVSVVERFLKKEHLRDPESYQSISWGKLQKMDNGTYQVRHSFRARNGFGGMNEQALTFTISSDGKSITNYY